MALSISGVTLNPQPSKMEVAILDISVANRNTQGDMLIDRLGTKRKISCEWNQLTNTQMSTILNTVTNIFFQVSYPDPLTGNIETKTFYSGDRTSPVYIYNNGNPIWQGLKFDLIEQ